MNNFQLKDHSNMIKGRFMYHNASNLFRFLADNLIPYAVLKGEPLSLLAYGRYSQRTYNDLDILVSRKDAGLVTQFLYRQGYKNQAYGLLSEMSDRERAVFCLANSHQMLPFTKQVSHGSMNIDLNFDVFWGEYTEKRINIKREFLSDTISMQIFRQTIFSLHPLKAVIHLCLHLYRDMNSIYILNKEKKLETGKLIDLHHLLLQHQEHCTPDKVYEVCKAYDIIPYVYYIFYFLNLIYEHPAAEFMKRLKTAEGEKLLSCYGLSEKERKRWSLTPAERLRSSDLSAVIMNDLTDQDRRKIAINMLNF